MTINRWRLAGALAVLVATLAAWRFAARRPVDRGFVRRDGDRLVLHGRTFRFVGANADVVLGTVSRQEVDRTLDMVGADRLGVVRLWALGETDGTEAWRDDFAFRRGRGGWIEASFVHLDRVLAAVRARGLRAIVVLANRLSAYGGLPQYLRWAGVQPRSDLLRASELLRAYSDPAVEGAWREHARRVVTRVNTVTGVAYRDDPTIMAWELMNEDTAPTCEAGDRLVRWVDRQSRFLHGLDREHLVSAGHFGYVSPLGRSVWQRVHALDGVDYADHHAYLESAENPIEPSDLAPWLSERVALARGTLGKPLVIGEVGFARDVSTPEDRARWYSAFLDAAERLGVSGVAVWMYQPWAGFDGAQGIFGWGPRAHENEPTRAALRRAALRWSRPPGEPDRPRVRRPVRLYDEGAVYIENTWTESAEEATTALDPWSLEEACARDPVAWLELPMWFPDRSFEALEITLASTSPGPFGLTVALDDVVLGRLDTANAVLRVDAARRGDHRTHWLRLTTTSPQGRALLRRYIAELPGADRFRLRVR